MEEKNDEQTDFMEVSRRSKLESPPESEADKKFDIVWKGASAGMVVGYSIAQYIADRNSAFGIYVGGDLGVLLFGFMGAGAVIGAVIEWLILKFVVRAKR